MYLIASCGRRACDRSRYPCGRAREDVECGSRPVEDILALHGTRAAGSGKPSSVGAMSIPLTRLSSTCLRVAVRESNNQRKCMPPS